MIDAVAYWPPTNKAYFFREGYYVRYMLSDPEGAEQRTDLDKGYWKGLGFSGGIDAIATAPAKNHLYFFQGNEYVTYRISPKPHLEGALHEPEPISDQFPNLPPGFDQDFDTVVYWPPNGKFYFFKGDSYVRYNPVARKPEDDPILISKNWSGLSFVNIDACLVGGKGRAYFFKGDEYITYLVAAHGHKALHTPRKIKDHWPRLLDMLGEPDIPVVTTPVVQPKLALWQDLDATTWKPAEQATEADNRMGFANLATMQALRMGACAGPRYYGNTAWEVIGPASYRNGSEIVEAIHRAHQLSGRPINQINIFGHSSGQSGIYGEDHHGRHGLYRVSKPSSEIVAKVISDLPKDKLANDLVVVLHGCLMADGANNFAKELFEFLSTGTPALTGVRVFAHSYYAAGEQNHDWVEFNALNPNGGLSTMPASIYSRFTSAENDAVNLVNRQILKR